ncbi:hypothetical protein TcWFU_001368 [Taenia crassiceps]|uniref:Uncharacterized protein n=1 Tax=Taenia crassiceps TaxID=6207 RepID=A0ABR4QNS9_9CEST
MFVSRFPFTAKFPQKENDHWLYVFHEDGRLGAVPINYVEESSLKSPEDTCRIIDSAIAAVIGRDIYEKETILGLSFWCNSEEGQLWRWRN